MNPKYPLIESATSDYKERTELNVKDSDGTLILCLDGVVTYGTKLTAEYARTHKKPLLVIDMNQDLDTNQFSEWLRNNSIKTLNIAGPRESHYPDQIYSATFKTLTLLLGETENLS